MISFHELDIITDEAFERLREYQRPIFFDAKGLEIPSVWLQTSEKEGEGIAGDNL